MEERDTFKLILNSKTYYIEKYFKRLSHVSKDIYKQLIQNNQYSVKSNVKNEIFKAFIDFWVDKTFPNITPENFYEFFQLNEEFGIMDKLIKSKELEFGESYQNIKILLSENDSKSSKSEEIISKKLDFYLTQYSNYLMQVRITSLYNIFNHAKRNLQDHNLAYSFIKALSEQKRNPDAFVLFAFLDLNKLNRDNLEESISKQNDRFGMMPNFGFPSIENVFPLNFLYAGPSLTMPGILCYLKNKQKMFLIDFSLHHNHHVTFID